MLEGKNMIKKITDKGEVLRKWYVKNDDGVVCNKTVLQKYFEKGYLDLPMSCYSAEDRKKAGELIAQDYFLGFKQQLKSIDFEAVNIRGTGDNGQEGQMFHRDRYLNAMKSVPYEFWPSVRRVCIEDKKLICDKVVDKNSIKNKNNSYYQKMLLNLGLERLIEFYLKKNKKSS
jgi:hypothetical protein